MIEYITILFNLSVTTCQISALWKSSLIISIPMPGKDTSHTSSYRPIAFLCPCAKGIETLILPTINKYLLHAPDQHDFIPEHSDHLSSAAVNNRHRNGIQPEEAPPATMRWMSCYLRGRQAKTCFRGVKLTSRKLNTGILQGTTLSSSLLCFYIADMPRPTEPVKWV